MSRHNGLIKLGFWFSVNEPKLPQPFIDKETYISLVDKEKVIKYLEAGRDVNFQKGWSACRICGCGNGSHEKTDGKYIWPSGLSHYIKEHDVKLPDEFYTHLKGWLE